MKLTSNGLYGLHLYDVAHFFQGSADNEYHEHTDGYGF